MESINNNLKGIRYSTILCFFTFICFSGYFNLSGQSLLGYVYGIDKTPIAGATIYISQLKTGTLANNNGKFEIKVPTGMYTVEFRSLGFKPEVKTIQVSDNPETTIVYLTEQTYSITEVEIKKGKEDPAYAIMRKAIALAPYYLNYVKQYKSRVYIKGSINIIKIPKLVETFIRSQGFPFKQGDAHVMESINDIRFTAPDKYEQKVISGHSTFPNATGTQPMGYNTGSFYQPKFYGAISPFSPQAFSYYNFRYEGVTFENGYSVLKIKVTPKQKGLSVFSGFLYLIDKTYNIYSVDFSSDFEFGQALIKQQYVNINNQAWLPVSQSYATLMKGFGGKAEAYYVISVKYNQLEINTELAKPLWLKDEKSEIGEPAIEISKKTSKNQAAIDKIMKKEQLTNRDMIKLAQIMKKELDSDTGKNSNKLEIKQNFEYTIEKDAAKKDSIYWVENRPIALASYEQKSLNKRDSVIKVAASDTTSKGKHRKHITPSSIILGRGWTDRDRNYYKFSGLLSPLNLSFNTVDGFLYTTYGFMFRKMDTTHWLVLSPALGYTFSRKKIYAKMYTELIYAPRKMGKLSLDAGHWSADFNHEHPIDENINTIASLLFKTNYLKLYDNRYIKIGNSFEFFNGFTGKVNLFYDNRTSLPNKTSFSFFYPKRNYTSNIPNHSDSTVNIGNYINSEASVLLEYTPMMKYRYYRDGRKAYVGSDFPTFEVEARKGFPDIFRSNSNYLAGLATIKQDINWGIDNKFHYKITAGSFFNQSNIHFADYFQPAVQESPINIEKNEDTYALLPYYKANTTNRFIEGHVLYSSSCLILKYIPLLSLTHMSEDLYFNYLHSKAYENHTEIGYGIGRLYLSSGNIIFFCGFDNFKFTSKGLKIVIQLKQ